MIIDGMNFEVGMKVRLVGLGVQSCDGTCILSGQQASGYIEHPDNPGTMYPVYLKLFGPGKIWDMVEILYVPNDVCRFCDLPP